MGLQGSEVRILSPRPFNYLNYQINQRLFAQYAEGRFFMGTHGVRKTASGLLYKTSNTHCHAHDKKRAQNRSQAVEAGHSNCR